MSDFFSSLQQVDDKTASAAGPDFFSGVAGTAQAAPATVAPPPQAPAIDFSNPVKRRQEIRKQIEALPKDQQPAALKAYAQAYVNREREKGFKPLPTTGGSWMDELSALADSALSGVSGGYLGAPYNEALAIQRERDKQTEKANPILAAVNPIVGGLGAAAAMPGVNIAKGAGLGSQVINGLIGGAGLGGIYGAGLGETTSQRVNNAGIGAATGGILGTAAPLAARGLGAAAEAIAGRSGGVLPQYNKGAVSRVSRAFSNDNMTPRQVAVTSGKLGPEGMLADFGLNLENQAGTIANRPGAGQQIINTALKTRHAGAKGRIADDVNRVLGPAQDVVALEQQALAQTRAAAKPFYDQFHAADIPMTRELSEVMKRVKVTGAVKEARKLMAIDGAKPSQNLGEYYDYVKRAIDDKARKAAIGSNEERLYSNLARDLRTTIDTILNPSNPAESVWARARALSGDGLQYREGLKAGKTAFAARTNPDQMRADVARMTGAEQLGYREGARQQVRDIMGNASTQFGENAATKARAALGSDNARAKLNVVAPVGRISTSNVPLGWTGPGSTRIGGQRATPQDLIRRLDAESRFAETRQNVLMNSKTAARQAAAKEFPADVSGNVIANEFGKKTVTGLGFEAGMRTLNFLTAGAMNARRAKIAEDAAKMLVSQGIDRDLVISGLMAIAKRKGAASASRQAIEDIAKRIAFGSRRAVIDTALPVTDK